MIWQIDIQLSPNERNAIILQWKMKPCRTKRWKRLLS
jgi:hypothetical protein